MMALGGLIMIGFGLIGLLAPEVSWWLEHGWKFKDAEPSEFALVMNRIGGGFLVLFGIVLIVLEIT